MTQRRCVVVLGMHRSGTSALTGCLSLLGVSLGGPLMEPTVDNERGYWELVEVGRLHDELLSGFGVSALDLTPMPDGWLNDPRTLSCRAELRAVLERNFSAEHLWTLKDPRLCLLLPLWTELFESLAVQPCFVLCLRNPWDVARSLESRDDLDPREALALWQRHVTMAEKATRLLARGIVSYEGFLADPRGGLDGLGEALGLSWPRRPVDVLPEVRSFLEPGLRHWRDTKPSPDVPESVAGAVSALHAAHAALGRFPQSPDQQLVVDRADAALLAALASWTPAKRSPETPKVVWRAAEVPERVRAAEVFRCRVQFRNEGTQRLSRRALAVSYHWLRRAGGGEVAVWDGIRTAVRSHVQAGADHEEEILVRAPDEAGSFVLAIDLVREGEYWLSSRGAPTARREVVVVAAGPVDGDVARDEKVAPGRPS